MDYQEQLELKACMQKALRDSTIMQKLSMKPNTSFRNWYYQIRKDLESEGFEAHRLCLLQESETVYIIYAQPKFEQPRTKE